MEKRRKAKCEILLYLPNLIGYARLGLFAISIVFIDRSRPVFLTFYGISAILDSFDGYLARKLGQVSAFGAWLDVFADNLERGFLWAYLHPWGYLISAMEWTCFMATHQYGALWKQKGSDLKTPDLVAKMMKNGFATPLGHFILTTIHVLPVWLYAKPVWLHYFPFVPMTTFCFYMVLMLCIMGRCLAAIVEIWFIYVHLNRLLEAP